MFDPNDFNQIARYVREQQAMYERAAMACGVNRYLAEFNTQQTATIGLANQLAKNWTPILTIMECWAEDARRAQEMITAIKPMLGTVPLVTDTYDRDLNAYLEKLFERKTSKAWPSQLYINAARKVFAEFQSSYKPRKGYRAAMMLCALGVEILDLQPLDADWIEVSCVGGVTDNAHYRQFKIALCEVVDDNDRHPMKF